MKPNKAKILKTLFPSKEIEIPALTGPELRIKSGLHPLRFSQEIRWLVKSGYVLSANYRYEITEAGKEVLIKHMEKEAREGKNQELFK